MRGLPGRLLVALGLISAASSSAFAAGGGAAGPGAAGAGAGAVGFNTNCSFCHQIAGQGVAGQFPRIAGRANVIAGSPAGRKYLSSLVLYGMAGQITVDGTPLIGVMPSFVALSDQTLAAILNYVTQLEKKPKAKPFTAAEIKAQRQDPPLSASAVLAIRRELKASELP